MKTIIFVTDKEGDYFTKIKLPRISLKKLRKILLIKQPKLNVYMSNSAYYFGVVFCPPQFIRKAQFRRRKSYDWLCKHARYSSSQSLKDLIKNGLQNVNERILIN